MKLFYFEHLKNFGDEINGWLWHQLLPGVLDEEDGGLFLGIGTYLTSEWIPPGKRIVVFGSGAGYGPIPQIDRTWTIYCVRGPLTAHALGLGREAAITDPAALVRKLYRNTGEKRFRVSYMPHHASDKQAHHHWQSICSDLGIHYIDPHLPVENVLSEISQTTLLVTEALHGAIVADALRIPWVPVVSSPHILRFKWDDWCQSVELHYIPQEIPAPPIAGESDPAKYDAVIEKLNAIIRETPAYLSHDNILDQRIAELDERLQQLRGDCQKNVVNRASAPDTRAFALNAVKESERRKEVITQRKTDVERWSDPRQLEEFWAKRAEIAATLVTPGSTVLDLGCGSMALEKLLPPGCQYIPCDMVRRDERTLVCDLNSGVFPQVKEATVITVLGVLEYIYEPEPFIKKLYDYRLPIIISYIPTDSGIYPDRPAMGWVNHLSWQELAAIFQRIGFHLYKVLRVDSSQVLMYMGHSPP